MFPFLERRQIKSVDSRDSPNENKTHTSYISCHFIMAYNFIIEYPKILINKINSAYIGVIRVLKIGIFF